MSWKATLAAVAPTIATAMGGPLAGLAVNKIAGVLGIDADESAIENAVMSGDPEVLFKLKTAEKDFRLEMRRLDIKELEIAGQDRQSARELFKVSKAPQIILSSLFIIGYFAILGFLISGVVQLPEAYKEVIILLLGIMTREVPTIMQFWFGSSAGSKDKAPAYDKLTDSVKKNF